MISGSNDLCVVYGFLVTALVFVSKCPVEDGRDVKRIRRSLAFRSEEVFGEYVNGQAIIG